MKLDDLLARLPQDAVMRISLSDPDCDVYNIAFLTDNASLTPHGDILYFTDSELLPASVPDNLQFNCVIVDGGPAPDSLVSSPNANLCWLRQEANLFACYNALQSTFLEDQELAGIVRRLLAAHFRPHGFIFINRHVPVSVHCSSVDLKLPCHRGLLEALVLELLNSVVHRVSFHDCRPSIF